MSAYHEYETTMQNQDCLVDALKDMGYDPQVHETAAALTGYQGDKRKQTAEIIIPRSQVGGASNDVGYKRQPDGTFKAIVSDYDGGYHFNKDKQKQVLQNYTKHKHLQSARKVGAKVKSEERKLINGKMCVVLKLKGK